LATIKIPYYTVRRNGRGFWEPRPHMRELGFYSVACGPDSPEARRIAEQWNQRWRDVKNGRAPSPALAANNLSPEQSEELTVYPPRSLGEAFRRYRRTDEWASKAPRTREDWWRCWRHIKPIFGDCDPRTVSLEDISAWRRKIEDRISLREAHRCVKIWRAMWKVSAALGYCIRDADPSLGVRNRAAPGRQETWTEGEAVRMFKRAWRDGYHGLAACIAVAWSRNCPLATSAPCAPHSSPEMRLERCSSPRACRLAAHSATAPLLPCKHTLHCAARHRSAWRGVHLPQPQPQTVL
jgi:hypothetical protein